jgi:MYXO-CTERM domain-containing protein
MCRNAFLAGITVCCLSAVAHANPIIISLGNWQIYNLPGQTTDTSGSPMAVIIDTAGGPPDDGISGVNLALSVHDPMTGLMAGPMIESVSIGNGTIFTGFSTTANGTNLVPLPAHRARTTQTTFSGVVSAGDGAGGPAVLAYLSFDGSTAVVGTQYLIYLRDPTIPSLSTNVPGFTVTLLDGSVTGDSFDMDGGMYGVMTVVPEPGAIVLAWLAAGGLCAAGLLRRRKPG